MRPAPGRYNGFAELGHAPGERGRHFTPVLLIVMSVAIIFYMSDYLRYNFGNWWLFVGFGGALVLWAISYGDAAAWR